MARTRTYIAADWTGDENLVDKLYEWNDSKHWAFHFVDAHNLTQSKDDSLACSIKKSLSERMNISKTFVLIVGASTINLTRGSCSNCHNLFSGIGCMSGNSTSFKSFIDYECEKAVRDGLKIVVLYNYASVDRSKCPEAVRFEGRHLAAKTIENGVPCWDYTSIKDAIMY